MGQILEVHVALRVCARLHMHSVVLSADIKAVISPNLVGIEVHFKVIMYNYFFVVASSNHGPANGCR